MDTRFKHFFSVWLLAVRPWAYSSSFLTVCLGAALAYSHQQALHWTNFFLTLLGVISFHTAANLLNDCYDFKRGLDESVNPNSGAIVRGMISARAAFVAACMFLVIGLATGAYLTWVAGWVVLLLGLLGTFIALTYTTASYCLKYNGLGDLAIFLAFGILPIFGTYWVQTQQFSWLPFFWSFPPALLTVGILHANNWRDIGRDLKKGCRTLAAMLGEDKSALYYRILISFAFALPVIYCLVDLAALKIGFAPPATMLIFLSLPFAIKLQKPPVIQDARPDISLDTFTAQLHLFFVSLLTFGFVISNYL